MSLDNAQTRQSSQLVPPPAPASPAPTPTRPGRGWSTGHVVGVVVGTLLALFSLGVFVVGATLAGVAGLVRDDDGFLMSDVAAVETSTYALTSTSFEVHTSGPAEGLPDALLGEVKVAASSPNGTPLFVGIAASDDVERYLGDVRHETVTGFALRPLYEKSGTQALTTAPEERDIWATRATGTNGDLVWDVDDGDWTLVVMNADGTEQHNVTRNRRWDDCCLAWSPAQK